VPASDLYALGVIIFEMFTGRLPFQADTAMELMMRHVDSPPPLASSIEPSVPPAIEALIASLLQKAPEDRPHGAGVVKAKLKAIKRELQEGQTTIGVSRDLSVRDTRPAEPAVAASTTRQIAVGGARRPLIVAAGVLLLVTAVLGARWALRQPAPPRPPPPPFIVEAPLPEPLVEAKAPEPEPAPTAEPAPRPAPAPAPAATPVRRPAKPPPPKAAASGTLQLVPSKVGGAVFIDGKAKGQLPQPPFELAGGTHQVRIENPGGRFERSVSVKAGETVEVRFTRDDFKP